MNLSICFCRLQQCHVQEPALNTAAAVPAAVAGVLLSGLQLHSRSPTCDMAAWSQSPSSVMAWLLVGSTT